MGGRGDYYQRVIKVRRASRKTPEPQEQEQTQTAQASTPSGYTMDDFENMSQSQRVAAIADILDMSYKVPSHLDDSAMQKVAYGLGLDTAPQVVSDDQLTHIKGREIYRTVYDAIDDNTGDVLVPVDLIVDQVKHGTNTHYSGSGGSLHGRALYFANKYSNSVSYGYGRSNPKIMRAKVLPKAKIATESTIDNLAWTLARSNPNIQKLGYADRMGIAAIIGGYDGWFDRGTGYMMMATRRNMVFSDRTKPASGYKW